MTGNPAAPIDRPSGQRAVWLAALRPQTLPAAIVPVIVGSALAWRAGHFEPVVAMATLAAATLIQIGTNLANDYYDFVSGADTGERLGPTRVSQAGLAEPRTVRNAAFGALGIAGVIGLYLVAIGGVPILIVGIVSIAAAIGYSAGPYPLAYHGLGDLFVFVFFGLVAVNGTMFLQTGNVTPLSIAASVPIGCIVTAILVVNNLRDIATDARANKHTLAVMMGAKFTRAEYATLIVVAIASVPMLAWLGGRAMWIPFVAAPIAYYEVLALYRRSGAELNASLAATARLHLVYGLLLAAAIVL
jgi:1,4-dihydroxy-2-naphthoate polyprenyltransferase